VIAEIAVYRRAWRPARPLTFAGRAVTTRESWLARVRDSDGREGWGEAAPLPGGRAGSGAVAGRVLIRWARDLAGRRATVDPAGPSALDESRDCVRRVARLLRRWAACGLLPEGDPAARFAAETALLRLVAAGAGESLCTLLGGPPSGSVAVAGLMLGGTKGVEAGEAQALVAAGHTTLKLKVGRAPIPDDIARVRRVREAVGDAAVLRLDANRAWEEGAAEAFGIGIRECGVAQVEEPLRRPDGAHALRERTGMRIAWDETLSERGLESGDLWSAADALVLKPTVLGGVSAVLGWWFEAGARRVPCVLSSAFESGVGLGALAELALALAPGIAAGLGTARWLPEDDAAPRPVVAAGAIEVPAGGWSGRPGTEDAQVARCSCR